MNDVIVDSVSPLTLVGGGQATVQDLHEALTLAPICVAADGGAQLALRAGVDLAAVIGDFDSVSDAARRQIPAERQYRVDEQMNTDFEKALLRLRAPVVLGLGFLGGRVDHQLAAFHALMRFAHQPVVLLGQEEIVFLTPPDLALPTRAGDLVSLFPMGEAGGMSEGLEWPIAGLAFRQGRKIGTSNKATGPVRITMQSPNMLTILPRRLVGAAVSALGSSTGVRWPVPPE